MTALQEAEEKEADSTGLAAKAGGSTGPKSTESEDTPGIECVVYRTDSSGSKGVSGIVCRAETRSDKDLRYKLSRSRVDSTGKCRDKKG